MDGIEIGIRIEVIRSVTNRKCVVQMAHGDSHAKEADAISDGQNKLVSTAAVSVTREYFKATLRFAVRVWAE